MHGTILAFGRHLAELMWEREQVKAEAVKPIVWDASGGMFRLGWRHHDR